MLALGLLGMLQNISAQPGVKNDSTASGGEIRKYNGPQKDLVDIFSSTHIIKNSGPWRRTKADDFRPHITVLPSVGYTLQTALALQLTSNFVFYTDHNDHSKSSAIVGYVALTQKHQVILPLLLNIWTKGNKFNIVSGNRYMRYPSVTYGLGATSPLSNATRVNYSFLGLHETVLHRVDKNLYAGIGYFMDYFWKITEMDATPVSTSPFKAYGYSGREMSAGWVLNVTYDSRVNQVNPPGGLFAYAYLRNNRTALGSDGNWTSALIELRKYIPLPVRSGNVLAVWSYNWYTLSGKPPYLMLPGIGWDDIFNTGRGYVQSRFKDRNFMYLETEYRYRILKSGLLGGVIFCNVQTYSSLITQDYNTFIPGYGAGLRICANKKSSTNLSIDYGFGLHGSRGFFVNLGEVF